ncbi:sigma factor-like helix-turn-helix DNA-binding protein [Caenispirillum bisanense]|uniref:sigma factor-like helix-turn-helix DNA-binding protein n=1 Tax=Caenispirillum bisanense TaxID=414052 RepID=UPI0031DFD238
MFDAHALRGLLPRLRRHAFLLTASRLAGDAAVAMAIARLPRDADGRPQGRDLAQLFTLVQEAARQVVCPHDGHLGPLHERLAALPPPQRAMLVLVTVEALPAAEAAAICGLAAEDGAGALTAARTALGSRMGSSRPRQRSGQGGGGARR